MCTVCGRQFHRSDYLKLHSYSHTDERPFNCHICGKGFKMNYNLKIHLKNHEDCAITNNNVNIYSNENNNNDIVSNSHVMSASNDDSVAVTFLTDPSMNFF